jgi:microcystin-dependent protein
MSRRAWLTPDNIPPGVNCFKIQVPDSLEFEAVFRGALLLLSKEKNWQQHGAATPSACAELWATLNDISFQMTPCVGGSTVSIGTFYWFAGPPENVPSNSLVCDGSSLSASAYPALFSAIGYTYGGSGDDFNLPDIYNETIVAARTGSYSVGDSGGQSTITLTVDQLPAHHHGVYVESSVGANIASLTGLKTSGVTEDTQDAGLGQSIDIRNPYIAMVPCIVVDQE